MTPPQCDGFGPLGPSKTVSKVGVADGPTPGVSGGYSVIEADDRNAAVELVRNHPYIARGGSLQVTAAVAP
jgi:hypothetical protein